MLGSPASSSADSGTGASARAGILIHERQLTWREENLVRVVDFGQWWAEKTEGLPLPLGANAIRRDIPPEERVKIALDIKRSIAHACETILDDTLAGVDLDDLMLVMSTGCAKEIGLSQELVDYIKGSPEALAQVRGELPNYNAIYGLPARLYGIPVVVEKTGGFTRH